MQSSGTLRSSGRKIAWVLVASIAAAAASGLTYHYSPRTLRPPIPGIVQSIIVSPTGTRVFVRDRVLIGELADFEDGFFAFLMFDYLRSRPGLAGKTVLLTSREERDHPLYRVLVRLPDNVIEGVNILAGLKADRLTAALRFGWIPSAQLDAYVRETLVFADAYSGKPSKHFRALHASSLQQYLRRFIRFKSETDPRISSGSDPIPSPLTRVDASRLAADIIAVARFYEIPTGLFLGIGAMENNYMNVAGDLKNTIWKRRAQPGDIVLRHWRGRVLVRNDSMGVWQITRESLRYAHQLYVQDKRDYKQLPARLRPPDKLELDSVQPDVLTTYAGLLLRNLLDRFNGDVTMAAGAYNGGPGNPNAHYAEGVELVANYARRVIGRAAEMDTLGVEQNSVSARKMDASTMVKRESEHARSLP